MTKQSIKQTIEKGMKVSLDFLKKGFVTLGSLANDPQKNLFKRYGEENIAKPLIRGVQELVKPGGIKQKGLGALGVAGGAISATPVGVAGNIITGVATSGARILRGQSGAFDVGKYISEPTSFAQSGLGIENPFIALAVDIGTGGGDPRAIRSLAKTAIRGRAVVSNFSFDPGERKAIELAEEILRNPESYLKKTVAQSDINKFRFRTPEALETAVNTLENQALETITEIGKRRLPKKELKVLSGDPMKLIKRLVDLDSSNKLAAAKSNVSVTKPYWMNFAEDTQPKGVGGELKKVPNADDILNKVDTGYTFDSSSGGLISGKKLGEEELRSVFAKVGQDTSPLNQKWHGKIVKTWTGDNDLIIGVRKNHNTGSTEYIVTSMGNKNPEYKGIVRVHATPLSEKDIVGDMLAPPTQPKGVGSIPPKELEVGQSFPVAPKSLVETPEVPPVSKPSTLEAQTLVELAQTPPKGYTEMPQVTKAVEETARQVKEPASVARRVVNAAREIKTKVVEYVQNEQERVRQLVKKPGAKVDDISDPYLKATLYPGRVAEKVAEGKSEAQAIIKDSKKLASELKTDLSTVRQQVNDYLHFRHAPERNLALGEGAAGVTTQAAEEGIKAIESSAQGARIKELAERASKLNEQTLDLLKNSGVISEELYTTLRSKYKYHVPLNRLFEESEDVGSVLSGRGFDVKSTGVKRAVGSERKVDDILGNIVSNYEQAVIRSEKNIVDQATLAFVKNNKDILGDLFSVVHPKAVGTTFGGQPMLEKTTDPSILQLFENGKRVWIKIKDPNLAVALRGVGREKLGGLLNAVSKFTRVYSGLATRFNPEFALPNKIRDLQETAVYLASQKGIGFKGALKMVTRDALQENTLAVLDHIRGKNTEGARLYQEMKSLGGTTGGFGLSTRSQVGLDLKSLETIANSKTKRIADNLVKYIDNWNTVFEDSTRLSVYRQALKDGLSKDRAAFLAKEASINFNRMGRGGPVINALWMFSNASIQGTAKMLGALKNPKVLGATTLAVGASVAAVNEWNDRVDPEWQTKVPKWDRLNGLTVMLPNPSGEGVKYITIPVSWGIKPIKVMADYAYNSLTGQELKVKDFMNDTVTSLLEAYNPVGGTDLISALTPTILDTPVDVGRNRSWSGSKIRPDDNPNVPEDIKYFQSLKETKTGQTAISISELLQSKFGVAVSPANLKYAFEQYVGGAGKAVSKTVNAIAGVLGSKPAPVDEYPIVSRFYRERTAEEVGQPVPQGEFKGLLEGESREKFKVKEKMIPVYERAQKFLDEGRGEEAQNIVDNLTDEEYAAYKSLKTADKRRLTTDLQREMYPVVVQVQDLIKRGDSESAQKIVEQMSSKEYEAYKSAKRQLGLD